MSFGSHLRVFLKDPKGVAALTPTSKATVARITARSAIEGASLIVEFGPGSGVVTRALLDRLPSTGRLVAIEANADFAARLEAGLDDPRLSVVHDSAQRVRDILAEHQLDGADCIVSGIPFFWLRPDEALGIVASTHAALRDGASFLTYQMFYQPRRALTVHLERYFRSIRTEIDFRNLPPLRISEAVK